MLDHYTTPPRTAIVMDTLSCGNSRIAPLAPNCYNRTEMSALKDRAKQLKKGATMAKKHKEVLKLLVTLEPGEDGYIIAECPAIPGCATQGKSEEEALANIKEAIVGCLKVRQEMGLPLTVETREVEVAL